MAVSSWQRLTKQVLAFVFPPTCAMCKQVGAVICDSCMVTLPRLQLPLCPLCSRTLDKPMAICWYCRKRPFPLKRIRAVFKYTSPLTELIYKLKYHNQFALAEPLGQQMAAAWSQQEISPSIVVPVPLHAERLRKRGYNQSMLLAKQLCSEWTLPLSTDALRRVRNTRPQVELDASERVQNVQAAFVADETAVADQHILLIDDVCTTGSTLTACTNALLAVGAASVSAYCLARAN